MNYEWRAKLCREISSEALYDEGIEAARNACAAGASSAAAAITAAAFYDNPLTGAPALRGLMERLAGLPLERTAWLAALAGAPHPETGDPAFTPGFGFVTPAEASAIIGALHRLLAASKAWVRSRSAFFLAHRTAIAQVAGPLNVAGLCALFFLDNDVPVDEAEALFFVMRIEPAIREGQRARKAGLSAFPFYEFPYVYEGTAPEVRSYDVPSLMKEVGLA